jgi:tetratricopeptide (TPR) repeat protein
MAKKKSAKSAAARATEQKAAALATPQSQEFFSPARIIALFAVIEIALILLMYNDYRIGSLRRAGDKAYEQQNYSKALHYYLKLLRIAPNSVTVNRLVANTYYSMGDLEKASYYYEQVLALDSTLASINGTLGAIYYRKGDPETALKYLEDELKRNPDDSEANFYMGKYLFDKGKYVEAAKYFQHLATNPSYRTRLKPYWKTIEEKVLRGESS